MRKLTKIARMAHQAGKSEKEFLLELVQRHGTQKDVALALRVTQSAVSQAFIRNGIRPVLRYEVA
ncbi:MAG: hypothetical protein MUF38_01505 [Anaerolineae bacterium]|nr:hypothetical protein [Anaerolineae bacterium]